MMDSGGHADEGARERGRKGGRQGGERTLRLRHFGQLDFLGERLVGGWVIECGGWRHGGARGMEGSIKVPLDSQDSKIDFITSAAPERGGS